jgi:hypothetical protein
MNGYEKEVKRILKENGWEQQRGRMNTGEKRTVNH